MPFVVSKYFPVGDIVFVTTDFFFHMSHNDKILIIKHVFIAVWRISSLGPLCWQVLTHWGRVTHICVSQLTIIGSDNGLVAWPAPSHYLNQCWNIVNKTLRNKLQWIFSRNYNISIQENVFESVVCEKAAILSRPQWVKWLRNNLSTTWYDLTLTGQHGKFYEKNIFHIWFSHFTWTQTYRW